MHFDIECGLAAGFGHKTQPGSIDLNSVRLCFQVFLEGPEKGQFKIPLRAVVSDPIYDKSKEHFLKFLSSIEMLIEN